MSCGWLKIGGFYVGTARCVHALYAREGPYAAIGALLPSSHAGALYLLSADTPRPTYSASDGITNAHSATIARPTDMFIHSYRPGAKLPARVPSVTDPDHTNVHPLYHLKVENPARSKPFFVRSQQGYPMLRGMRTLQQPPLRPRPAIMQPTPLAPHSIQSPRMHFL